MAKAKAIGEVVHWYDKLGVAVVKLKAPLTVGDHIKVKRGENEFEDTVVSMQFDHAAISAGKKGQEVAVKLSQAAKEGAVIMSA